MAIRRMFSVRLVNSTRFLKMPISTQALYFHLGLKADDDGIVEAYQVIKMVGCTEDDLKVLVAKGFVKVLNEDLVTYITDWNENNHIRADRKIDSMYKDLLIQMVQDEKRLTVECLSDDGQVTDICQPSDNQVTTKRQHRLGKDRIGKVRKGKDRVEECTEPKAAVPAVILNTGDEWLPSVEDVKEWIDLYPNVDVVNEFGRMRQWCKSNPTKRKTLGGVRRFVQTWLDREQNKIKPSGEEKPQAADKYTERINAVDRWGMQHDSDQ